jgi:hypothetical protein
VENNHAYLAIVKKYYKEEQIQQKLPDNFLVF